MESVYRSVAGIDVHKKMLAVVIRRQAGEQAEYEKRKFGATRAEIQHLYAAQELISEIGPKACAFASAEQFASWVGVCPGSQQSAGINL